MMKKKEKSKKTLRLKLSELSQDSKTSRLYLFNVSVVFTGHDKVNEIQRATV